MSAMAKFKKFIYGGAEDVDDEYVDYDPEEFTEEEYEDYDDEAYEDDEAEEYAGNSGSRMSDGKSGVKKSPKGKSQNRQIKSRDICVFKPTSTNDMRTISQSLINGTSILLNLVGMDVREAQRIIDFVSGACFAVDGNFRKAEDCIFVVTPKNVDICGDLQDALNGELGVPEIQTDDF